MRGVSRFPKLRRRREFANTAKIAFGPDHILLLVWVDTAQKATDSGAVYPALHPPPPPPFQPEK